MFYNILVITIENYFSTASPYIVFNLVLNPLIFIVMSSYFIKKEGISLVKSFLISLAIASIVIIGSRIIYVILASGYYKDFNTNPWKLAPRDFTMFGGFVLVIPIVNIISKILNIRFWRMLDLLTPGWALGIVFNKTGCLLNGCCFGIPTNFILGISYPEGTQPYNYFYNELISIMGRDGSLANSIPIHPVQSYEALVGLLGFIISVILLKKKPKEGVVFASFAMVFSFARLLLNNLRATPYSMMEIKPLLPLLYLGVFIVTVFIFIYITKSIKN